MLKQNDNVLQINQTMGSTLIFNRAKVNPEVLKDVLNNRLQAGIAHFVYERADGELREAYGTLKPELIPNKKQQQAETMYNILEGIEQGKFEAVGQAMAFCNMMNEKPVTLKRTDNINQFYYDLSVQGWRKFNPNNLIVVL